MNVLPVTRQRAVVAATLGVVGLFSAQQAPAADATWVANPTDPNWTTPANWSTNAVPGAVNPNAAAEIATLGQDVVTFNTPLFGGIGGASNPIVVDAQRQVKSVLFDAGAGAYTFSGGPLFLSATRPLDLGAGTNQPGDGSITLNSGVTNAQHFTAPITFRLSSSTNGAYALVNNAASPAATLTFDSLINGSAATRPLVLTLDGSNTGNNTIASLTEGGATLVVKNGAGTWILSGANTISSQPDVGVTGGATVNAGVLALQNAGALGTVTAPNIVATGTGTLRIDNVALNNAGATLDQTGTIQGTGGATLNSLIVAATATDVNLSTASAADVFTVGATAAASGGAAATNLHITGPGTVNLANASTFAGSVSADSGTLQISNATALGAAATANLKFANASTGVVQLNGVSVTVNGLQGTSATSAIESSSGTNTLTVANANANQYGGQIRDGAGQVVLVKNAGGVLALTGNSTYTGGTTVNAGSLLANNVAGSATGSGAVTVNAGATLGGSGTANGVVNVATNARLAPGAAAGQVGTLTVGGLTLASGSQLDFDTTSAANTDKVIVSQNGGLTINGGQLNFNGGTLPVVTNGVYNLIGYTGAINGTGIGALSLNANNKSLATNSYTFGTAGGYVTLTIASTGGTVSYWNADANGTWTGGPWTPSQPNSVGAFASFGGGGTPITANRTITVDSNKTVGTIAFNQPNGFSYTLAGPGTITLDNGSGPAFVSVTAGSHTINAPLATTANGATFTVSGAGNTLTTTGAISGNGAVNKAGLGTLVLNGNNTYTGGTALTGGTVQINSATSLGDANGAATFAGGTLQLSADVTTARTYVTDVNGSDIRVDTNGFNLTQNGTLIAGSGAVGGLTKLGNGTLTLSGANTYTGTTSVTGGTLSVSSNGNLGAQASGGGINLSSGGTLATTATLSLNNGAVGTNDRAISVGVGGGTIDVAPTTVLTASGVISGTGTLTKANAGTLTLTNTGNTAAINVTGGILRGGNTTSFSNGGLGTGQITLQGGSTLNTAFPAANTLVLANTLTVPAGQVGTFTLPGRIRLNGPVTGNGTLNVAVASVADRTDFQNNFAGFTGTLNITGTGSIRLGINALASGQPNFNAAGWANTTMSLDGVTLAPSTNSGGNTIQIGALTNTGATGTLGGGTAGRATYSIGGLNTSTTFGGVIAGNSTLTKVGSGSLTLTGVSTYTGITTVNGGSLVINGVNALGGAVYAGTTLNGGTLGYVASFPGTNGPADITADATGAAKPVTLGVNGGTVNTNGNAVAFANPISGSGAFTKAGAGTLTFNAVNTYAGATNVTGGTLVSGTQANTTALLANANGINVATGQIELNYDAGNSPASTVRSLLAASYTAATTPGVMETGQIRSTTATLTRGLGYKDTGTTVVIKATLFGDADLDGGVSINDFNALSANFGQSTGKVWVDGDFDYDGGVSINDFNLLAGGFGQSVPASSELWSGLIAFAAAHNDLAAFEAVTGVPEPTSLGLIAAGATLGLRRRRRTA